MAHGQELDTNGKLHVYLGTYTGPKSQGIYRAQLDLTSGQLSPPELVGEAVNPSFLNIHPNQKFLYAVNNEGQSKGGVLAFAIQQPTGKLTRLGNQAACGNAPCYLTVDRSGQCVLVASYSSGTVAALPDPQRRQPGRRYRPGAAIGRRRPRAAQAACPLDQRRSRQSHRRGRRRRDRQVVSLPARSGTAQLSPGEPPFVRTRHGSAPRHFAFHPGGKFAYSNLEASSQITAFAYDALQGTLTELETLSTLPEPVAGNSTAEIQVHPNGRFVYVSNRGHNSIAMFAIDPQTGRLTALGQGRGGRDTTEFRHRSQRPVFAGGPSRDRQRRGVSHRSANRQTDSQRPEHRAGRAGLREVRAGGGVTKNKMGGG